MVQIGVCIMRTTIMHIRTIKTITVTSFALFVPVLMGEIVLGSGADEHPSVIAFANIIKAARAETDDLFCATVVAESYDQLISNPYAPLFFYLLCLC
jgi:hypothetical protein